MKAGVPLVVPLPARMELAADEHQGRLFVRVSSHTRDGRPVQGYLRRNRPGHRVHFASGSSRPADLQGFTWTDQPIGVTVPELTDAAMDQIRHLPHGRRLFVDSGAFREVDRDLRTVRPMTDDDWLTVLSTYQRIVTSSKARASFVAPDRVGDAVETLRRLRRYRGELLGVVRQGYQPWVHNNRPEVLVPLHAGLGSLDAAWTYALHALDFPEDVEAALVPAIPANKAAWPHRDIVRFVVEYVARRPFKPLRRLHLLGLGPDNPSAETLLQAIEEVAPDLDVSMDSNVLASKVGLTNGPGGDPRAITAAQKYVRERYPGASPAGVRARAIEIAVGYPRDIRSFDLAIEQAVGRPERIDALRAERAKRVALYEAATGRSWSG